MVLMAGTNLGNTTKQQTMPQALTNNLTVIFQALSHHHSNCTDRNVHGDVYSMRLLGLNKTKSQLISPFVNQRATLNLPLCKPTLTLVLHHDWLQQLFK